MPVLVALLFLIVAGFAAPLAACGTGGASTFCEDGWISAPVGRARAPQDSGVGMAMNGEENAVSEDDIYVEGAVLVDPAPADDEGL